MEHTQPENKTETQRDFFISKKVKWTVISIGGLIIVVGAFSLGIKVGLKEARFTQNWSQNYPKNFGRFIPIMPSQMQQGYLINSHGIVGTILSEDKNNSILIVKGQDNVEKTVTVEPETTIRQNFTTLKATDLKINQSIIVIGEPSEQEDKQGQIEAKFIRVLNQP